MGKDSRAEVQRMLLNYRSTVHPSTGSSLAELIMGRNIWSKIPDMRRQTNKKVEQARKKEETTHKKRKEDYDIKRRVKVVEIKEGDKVLSQKKSSLDQ